MFCVQPECLITLCTYYVLQLIRFTNVYQIPNISTYLAVISTMERWAFGTSEAKLSKIWNVLFKSIVNDDLYSNIPAFLNAEILI